MLTVCQVPDGQVFLMRVPGQKSDEEGGDVAGWLPCSVRQGGLTLWRRAQLTFLRVRVQSGTTGKRRGQRLPRPEQEVSGMRGQRASDGHDACTGNLGK